MRGLVFAKGMAMSCGGFQRCLMSKGWRRSAFAAPDPVIPGILSTPGVQGVSSLALVSSGVDEILAGIPGGKRYYVTIDIDAFDTGIAPGSGSPSIGGLDYYEVTDLLR